MRLDRKNLLLEQHCDRIKLKSSAAVQSCFGGFGLITGQTILPINRDLFPEWQQTSTQQMREF
ncbi:MAG: hypothetical protein AAGH78_06375 [Cyanobacteria bacterium P01_H01_bin.58]